jgi:hypothetical protein
MCLVVDIAAVFEEKVILNCHMDGAGSTPGGRGRKEPSIEFLTNALSYN